MKKIKKLDVILYSVVAVITLLYVGYLKYIGISGSVDFTSLKADFPYKEGLIQWGILILVQVPIILLFTSNRFFIASGYALATYILMGVYFYEVINESQHQHLVGLATVLAALYVIPCCLSPGIVLEIRKIFKERSNNVDSSV